MARWSRLFAVVLTILGAAAAPALAQIQTGSLLVRALDDQNAVVPGVTVTVTSPVLPQAIVGVTDSSGVFQMPGLGVGSVHGEDRASGLSDLRPRKRRRASGPDGQRGRLDESEHDRGRGDRAARQVARHRHQERQRRREPRFEDCLTRRRAVGDIWSVVNTRYQDWSWRHRTSAEIRAGYSAGLRRAVR